MAHLDTPHCANVAVLFTHSVEAVVCELTFSVRDTSDALFAAPSAFATQVWAAVLAHLVPAAAPEVIFNGIVFEDVRTLPYGGATYPQTPTAGTNGTAARPLPTSAAFAVKKITNALGRSGRGRWYFPIWDGDFLTTADTVVAATVTGIVASCNAFQVQVEGGTYPCEVGIISEQNGGTVRAHGVFEPIVQWSSYDNKVDSQRRRLLGRGR